MCHNVSRQTLRKGNALETHRKSHRTHEKHDKHHRKVSWSPLLLFLSSLPVLFPCSAFLLLFPFLSFPLLLFLVLSLLLWPSLFVSKAENQRRGERQWDQAARRGGEEEEQEQEEEEENTGNKDRKRRGHKRKKRTGGRTPQTSYISP